MGIAQLVTLVAALTALVGAVSAGLVAVINAMRTKEVHQAVSDDLQTIAHATPGVVAADLATPIVVDGRPASNVPAGGSSAPIIS